MIEESIVQPFFNAEIIDFKLIGSGWHNRLFLINNCHVARLSFTEHGKQKMILYNKVQDSIKLPINTPKYESLKLINDSSLRAHKNSYGMPCSGRTAYLIGNKYSA